jgi:hypothetical protein
VEDGHRVLVADNEDVEREVAVELFDPCQGDVLDQVLLEVEPLEAFGVVLDQDALALGLDSQRSTYFSCLTMAQIMVV